MFVIGIEHVAGRPLSYLSDCFGGYDDVPDLYTLTFPNHETATSFIDRKVRRDLRGRAKVLHINLARIISSRRTR